MRKLSAWSALWVLILSGCGGNGGDSSSPPAPPSSSPPPATSCGSPAPAAAMDQSVVVNVPSDFDPTSNPTPTTRVFFTVLLPSRCPGDHFPLILQSHGYGGNRIKTLAADGSLKPGDAFFPSIDELVQALPYHGYVVISYDERGHGDTVPANGGGYARIIDPRAEVQDARAIIDWAHDNADAFAIQTEPGTGIAKDVRVGTIGLSYGGGYQFTLAALDPRIDTIVPNGTWYDLLYSLLPGDAVKLSFGGLLCLLATTATTATPPLHRGVSNTPLVATLCNTIGVQGPAAMFTRTHAELATAVGSPLAQPRSVTDAELVPFFFTHGTGYLEKQQRAGLPWGFGESEARLRSVPALFLQGNRDVLFNLTEAYLNARYFGATGADVRLLSTEGGHMNPLANQVEGTGNCGKVIGVASILAWFDEKLKGQGSATFDAIPKVCISVADTIGAPNVAPVGVILDSFPVGSLSGTGAVPATVPTLSASVAFTDVTPAFAPVVTVHGAGQVLAGVPRIASLSVAKGAGALQTAIAYVGIGILRGGKTFLVDDQVTPFAEGEHHDDAGLNAGTVLLPAVGERLQDGDQVGLLFYPHHVQYAAVLSAASVPGATNVVNTVLHTSIPPVLSALDTSFIAPPNPYSVTATQVELPILIPGQYPGSRLSQ